MGRYITWADVADRYSDAAKTQGGAPNTQASFIQGAEAEVDGRLAVNYTVPFSPVVPDQVKDLAIDVAYFKMTFRQANASTKILKSYIDDRFLGLLNGTITLTASGGLFSAAAGAFSSNTEPTRFGTDEAVHWRVSSQELVDNMNARYP